MELRPVIRITAGLGGLVVGEGRTLTLREETAQRFLPSLHGTGRDVQGHCPSQRSPHWIFCSA